MKKVARFGPDDVIFSRQGTEKAYSLYRGAEDVLDLGTIAGGNTGRLSWDPVRGCEYWNGLPSRTCGLVFGNEYLLEAGGLGPAVLCRG